MTTATRTAPKTGTRTGTSTGSVRKGHWLLLSLAILAIDQWSKWLVEVHLPFHASQPLIPGVLNLTHVRNTGVAFGLFSGRATSAAVAVLGLLALVLVGAYFARTRTRDRWLLTALSLVMGGAVGNLTDRLVSGAVTDFVDVYLGTAHWPSFNVADSAITVGIAALALDILHPRRRGSREETAPGRAAGTGAVGDGTP